jgi:hypothetical protein
MGCCRQFGESKPHQGPVNFDVNVNARSLHVHGSRSPGSFWIWSYISTMGRILAGSTSLRACAALRQKATASVKVAQTW